jgi:hypothetical protein
VARLLLQFPAPTDLALVLVLQPIMTAAPIDTGAIIGLLVFSIVCFALLAFFVRGAVSDRRPSPA